MNFSLVDRQRSLRRFLMMSLGAPPWRIYIARDHVGDDERPAAIVEPGSPSGRGRPARISLPQGNRERMQTHSIALFPSFMTEDEEPRRLSVEEAAVRAHGLAQRLEDSIALGLIDDDGEAWSYPERIPVFDFDAVPVLGAQRGGPDEPYGWMWVEDFPVRPVQDNDDPLRWTVVSDLRVSWEAAGRAPLPGPPAGSMHGTFTPQP